MQGSDGENIKQNQVGSHRVREEQFAEIDMVYVDIYNCGNRASSVAIQSLNQHFD